MRRSCSGGGDADCGALASNKGSKPVNAGVAPTSISFKYSRRDALILWSGLQHSAVIVNLVISHRFGNLKLLVGLGGPAKIVVGLGKKIVHPEVLRVELQGALQKTGGDVRVALLQRDLAQQDIRP